MRLTKAERLALHDLAWCTLHKDVDFLGTPSNLQDLASALHKLGLVTMAAEYLQKCRELYPGSITK